MNAVTFPNLTQAHFTILVYNGLGVALEVPWRCLVLCCAAPPEVGRPAGQLLRDLRCVVTSATVDESSTQGYR